MKKFLQIMFLLSFCSFAAISQDRKIAGQVISADDGLPIPGASVVIEGTKTGVQTGPNGNFSIAVPAGKRLTISFIGYFPQTVSVSGTTTNVQLVPDVRSLNEVVVTGYTNTSRANSASAATTVTSEDINFIPQASIDQLLQARVPGMNVSAGSGQPGSAARVTVRGQGSFSGGVAPLYILDGAAIETAVFQTLNPNDIENVVVLKDATSTSQYGSRGANGVVVITTKKGKAGLTTFNFNGQYGRTMRTQPNFDMLTTTQLLAVQEAGKAGAGWLLSPLNTATNATYGSVARKAQLRDSVASIQTNWDDLFLRNASFQNHQVSALGGSEKTKFYSSLNYYNEDGIAQRSGLERYNFRTNLDHTSGKFNFSAQTGLGYSRNSYIESENGIALANPYAAAYLAFPYESPYDRNGNIITSGSVASYGFVSFDSRLGSNALDRINSSSLLTNQIKGNLNLNGSYEIVKGLKAKAFFGTDFRETNQERSIYPGTYPGSLITLGQSGSYNLAETRALTLTSNGGLGYFNTINNKHTIDASLLGEIVDERYNSFGYTGYGINPKLKDTPAGITAGTTTNALIPALSGYKTHSAFASLIALARYTYNNKYTLQGSYRRDGSSRLPEDNRFHNFYSGGVNWDVMKENFMSNLKWIDALRLRASYGTVASGNGTTDFGYIATYANVSYNGNSGIAPSSPGNENYDWEYRKKANIGFDLSVLKNRANFQVDLYNELTYNGFISQQLSRTAGFSSLSINAGEIRNRGIETAANFTVFNNKDWNIGLNANFSYNKNEVTDLGQVNEFEQGTSIIRVGIPLGSHYAVKYAGVDPQTGVPLYYNRDGSTTPTYSSATQSVAEFGTFNAPFVGGFGSDMGYKNFNLSVFFNFMDGFSRYNNESFFITSTQTFASYNQTTDLLNYWTTPGQITQIPKLGSTRQFSSYDIRDASFLRLRNISLSYSLPKALIQRAKVLSGARLYVQGQNLYTWTKWQGFDPEDNNNIAGFEYPASRKYTFGLDVKF